MAQLRPLQPSAASLFASMRDLGYSLETAVADIVDNSISADATTIKIICDLSRESPTLVILDNGKGMSGDGLINAMRHGSINPRQVRAKKDLGRFGLGLKTASFSQCRQLTVISSQNGNRSGAEWNLDLIEKSDEWLISVLEGTDFEKLPYIDHLGTTGTLVVWQELDRLFEDESSMLRDEIVNEKLDILEKHLALVFHRFIAGELKGRKKIAITINGHPVEAFDPFCRKSGSQMLPEDIVMVNDESIHIQAYILPHHSRLSAHEYDFYQNRSDFISNQGAYVYRNGRLMAWGDWFRLIPKGEATKLARVQIDFPNSLDEAWTIDIKKSRARPPQAVRERLRQIIPQITGRSTRVHKGRGEKLFDDTFAPVWERYADHTGIRYTLNQSHPIIKCLEGRMDSDSIKHLKLLLDSIATSLPIEMLYADYSTHPRDVNQIAVSVEDIKAKLRELKIILFGSIIPIPSEFINLVRSTRMFENQMDIVEQFVLEEC
jgi:hypothetical protein